MDNNQTSQPDPSPFIVTLCLISALCIFLVSDGNFIFGSDAGNWTYLRFTAATPYLPWIPFAIILFLAALVFAGARLIHIYEGFTLAAAFLISLSIQILLNSLYPISLDTLITSDLANSFYSIAQRYSPTELLSQILTLLPDFPYHGSSNMPGKILFFQFLGLFTSSPRIMAYLIIAISTLGAPLLYWICKKLFQDRTVAFYAFILYALIPCKLFFFPILNTVAPVFILACLSILILYLDRKKPVFLVLLGAALYLLVLFDPSPLATGIIFIAVIVYAFAQKQVSLKEIAGICIIPIIAFAAFHLVMQIAFSFSLIDTFRYVLNDAADFNLRDNRDYWTWIGENTKTFFFDTGLPVMMIFLLSLTQTISQLKALKFHLRRWSMEHLFTLALLLTYLIVLFLGINRGETTRLWIYLAVFFQIPAACYLGRIVKNNSTFFLVALTLAAQSFVTLQTIQFITP